LINPSLLNHNDSNWHKHGSFDISLTSQQIGAHFARPSFSVMKSKKAKLAKFVIAQIATGESKWGSC
jgi:hypothetical protein